MALKGLGDAVMNVRSTKQQQSVAVYVRVRPLTESELLDSKTATQLEGLTLTCSIGPKTLPKANNEGDGNDEAYTEADVVAYENAHVRIAGFSGLFGQTSSNRDVFQECFNNRLPTVLRGGTASLFCYGYTGGGKTHTSVGHGDKEKGLFFLAAERLLRDLSVIVANDQGTTVGEDEKLFLRATAIEIYRDAIYDLVSPSKRPCKIRVDRDGHLVVHGEATTKQLGGLSEVCRNNGRHATLVTTTPGLCSHPIHSAQDLEALSKTCINRRASGTSSVNATSSRSHAILRLEVVSGAINQEKDRLQTLEAELPALRNAYDNNCDSRDDRRKLNDRIKVTESSIQSTRLKLERLQSSAPAAIGGSMLLVDLAGADYDHRGGEAQQESIAINFSLLALKDCFQSIATAPQQRKNGKQTMMPRAPFRRSQLTRILEDSLDPAHHSRRRNKESVSVMLVNVSPSASLKHGTLNALRYGQLLACSEGKTQSTKPFTQGEGRMAKIRRKALKEQRNQLKCEAEKNNDPNVDPEVWKQRIRALYADHVPEKTSDQVEDILVKFAGREQSLLERVKLKYTVQLVDQM